MSDVDPYDDLALEPCPCGGEADMQWGVDGVWVRCLEDDCRRPATVVCRSAPEAAAAWNHPIVESRLRAEIAALIAKWPQPNAAGETPHRFAEPGMVYRHEGSWWVGRAHGPHPTREAAIRSYVGLAGAEPKEVQGE